VQLQNVLYGGWSLRILLFDKPKNHGNITFLHQFVTSNHNQQNLQKMTTNKPQLDYQIREATANDIEPIQKLMLEHGPNQWNYLPEQNVREHIENIRNNKVFAVIAEIKGKIIGVVTFEIGKHYPQYQPKDRENEDHGYIAEAVVDKNYTGHRIGPALLQEAIKQLATRGIREIYAKRHEENRPSARMMEQAGMETIDTFPDEIRTTGSQRTAVCRIVLDSVR
jgi:L-amino acid N-acyltransferase YncA